MKRPGLRIRESFAIDFDVVPNMFESMGMLDVKVTMPADLLVRTMILIARTILQILGCSTN